MYGEVSSPADAAGDCAVIDRDGDTPVDMADAVVDVKLVGVGRGNPIPGDV